MTNQEIEKSERKKRKGNKYADDSEEEDIDAILLKFHQEQEEKFKVTEEADSAPISRRCNGSMIINPLNSTELLFFGGETYDGNKFFMYNDFYRYKTDKNKWTRITSANAPGPRSSHQCVASPNGKLYLFGGEYVSSNETSFFHYKDFWSFDLKSNQWEQMDILPKPSPRSGHRMTLWKNYLILFGGFYDIGREVKYHDDLWAFNTVDYTWTKLDVPEPRPSARSGFQFFAHKDTLVLYGGYCKQTGKKNQESKATTHTDVWHLKMSTNLKEIRWERKKGASALEPKSGCTMVYYKSKGIMYGGVKDIRIEDDRIDSVCLDEMLMYNIDSNRWFPLSLKSVQPKKKKKPQKQQKRHSRNSDDADDDDSDAQQDSDVDDEPENVPALPVIKPSARFNAMLAVVKNTLYLYGGILEHGNKDVTLADFWSINLDKMNEWTPIIEDEDLKQILLESQEVSEDEEEDSDDDDDEESDGEDSDDEEEEKEIPMPVDTPQESVPIQVIEEPAAMNKEMIPLLDETLREYASRTQHLYEKVAFDLYQVTGKELRKQSFELAKQTFEEWQPKLEEDRLLYEMNEIELKEKKDHQQSDARRLSERNRR